jgi:amino acid transporter
MSDRTPAPVPQDPTPPRLLRRARTLWLLSFLAGLTAAALAFLGREEHLDRIAGQVRDLAPERPAGTVGTAAQVVLTGTVAAIVLVVVVEGLLVRRMLARHGGARVGLTVLLTVQAVVALVAEAYLTVPGPDGLRDRLVLLLWVALAALAYLVALAPSVGRWLRAR